MTSILVACAKIYACNSEKKYKLVLAFDLQGARGDKGTAGSQGDTGKDGAKGNTGLGGLKGEKVCCSVMYWCDKNFIHCTI